VSLRGAYVCVVVLPNLLSLPFEALRFMDYGMLILLSLAIAVFWGVIIKLSLGLCVLLNSTGPTKPQGASQPKVPIAAGVG
jgi:hypothetical protein